MTKKDFIKFAGILKHREECSEERGVLHLSPLLDDLCEMFKADNPNFDEDRFRNAVN